MASSPMAVCQVFVYQAGGNKAADGGSSSVQTISHFLFLSFLGASIGANGTNLLVSGPAGTPWLYVAAKLRPDHDELGDAHELAGTYK